MRGAGEQIEGLEDEANFLVCGCGASSSSFKSLTR